MEFGEKIKSDNAIRSSPNGYSLLLPHVRFSEHVPSIIGQKQWKDRK